MTGALLWPASGLSALSRHTFAKGAAPAGRAGERPLDFQEDFARFTTGHRRTVSRPHEANNGKTDTFWCFSG